MVRDICYVCDNECVDVQWDVLEWQRMHAEWREVEDVRGGCVVGWRHRAKVTQMDGPLYSGNQCACDVFVCVYVYVLCVMRVCV